MIPVRRLRELDDYARRRLLVRGRLGDPEVVDVVAAR